MSVRRAIVIALVVGVGAALLRSLAFRGEPFAQAVCGLVVGLAIVTYGIARFLDRDRSLPGAVYLALIVVGAALSGLWIARLL